MAPYIQETTGIVTPPLTAGETDSNTNGYSNGHNKGNSKHVLNVGVVGIGRMGQQHALNILNRVPRAKLICACSPAPQDLVWAETNLVPHGVAVYASFEEMIATPGLDAVIISSSNNLHYEHSKPCLQRGIHVLCEKPISQSVEEIEDLIAVAKASNTKIMCGFTRRFDDDYLSALQKIRQDAIGSPVVIRSQGLEKLDLSDFNRTYLLGAGKVSGFFLDSFIHDIDLSLAFMEADGQIPVPRSVCALGSSVHFTELEKLGDADNAVGIIQFWGGQISFHYNSRTAAAGYDNQTEVFGTKGKISVNLVSKRNRVEVSDNNGIHIEAMPGWADKYKESFVEEVVQFTDAILQDRPLPVPMRSCVTSLSIAKALQDSLRSGRKIEFDESGRRLS
jgi:myo-inositol 2-dehydrogenase / D-chiro-inositol 1-dehydrogenase